MSDKIAVTDNGKHKLGKKLFLTDENSVHRKAKKAFLTKDGVHKLVFSSGVIWEKYACEVESGDYYLIPNSSLIGTTHLMATDLGDEVYVDYEFSPSEGFVGIDPVTVESEDDAKGRYIVESNEVYIIIDMWHTETTDVCGQYADSYSCGSTLYGTLEVEDGELPESGTLIEGSATDSYCVLLVDSNHYYYVRGD